MMKSFPLYHSFCGLCTLLGLCLLASCSQPGDHNLNDLDKARVDVKEAMQVVAEWNMDSVDAAKGRVAMRFKDLDWLMADTTMTFGVDDAQLIGHWERVRRFFKKTPAELSLLEEQGELCLSQLNGLSKAIRAGATVDANGTPMDASYFDKETKRELQAALRWTTAVGDIDRLFGLGLELEAQKRAAVDSLILAKRAEWAQSIAGMNPENAPSP